MELKYFMTWQNNNTKICTGKPKKKNVENVLQLPAIDKFLAQNCISLKITLNW